MSLSLSIATYFICWWIVLFAILPLKLGRQPEEGAHDIHAQASGAPLAPHLPLKFLLTTLISMVVFAAIYSIVTFKLITLESFPF